MAEPPADPPILNYATPGQVPRRNWEGWPLASGAAYGVFTFIWSIFVCVWILDPSTRTHMDFKIITWIFAIASTTLGPLFVNRAKRHNRPTWLEVSCFRFSMFLLLTLFTCLVFGLVVRPSPASPPKPI